MTKVISPFEKSADVEDVKSEGPSWRPSWLSPPMVASPSNGPGVAVVSPEGRGEAETGAGAAGTPPWPSEGPPKGRPWKPLVAGWDEGLRSGWAAIADNLESRAGLSSKEAEALAYLIVAKGRLVEE